MKTVTLFKYLGRVLIVVYDDCPEVEGNLSKARNIWVRMTRILFLEKTDQKVLGLLFKTVVLAVFLFGAYVWVLTTWIEWELSSFHQRVT